MTSYDLMKNQLRLADECSETVKRTEQELLIKLKFSFALYLIRAICAAITNVADVIRDK